MRRMSVLAAMVAVVVLGLIGFTGTSLAATSQSVAHPDGGAGPSPKEPGFSGWRDGQYAGFGYSGCEKLAEPTGIKVPVYTPYYGTESAYPDEGAFAEAEFEIAKGGCQEAVWVTVHYKEPNPKYNVVIDTRRLYSSKAAETSIAQLAGEPGPLYGDQLDGREGCIQASIYIDGAYFLGLPSPAATMEWGNCVPPWLGESTPAPPKTETKVPVTETKVPVTTPVQHGQYNEPYYEEEYPEEGSYFNEGRPVVVVYRTVRVGSGSKVKVTTKTSHRKVKKAKKHRKHHHKAKRRQLRKKHTRPYGITEVSGGD